MRVTCCVLVASIVLVLDSSVSVRSSVSGLRSLVSDLCATHGAYGSRLNPANSKCASNANTRLSRFLRVSTKETQSQKLTLRSAYFSNSSRAVTSYRRTPIRLSVEMLVMIRGEIPSSGSPEDRGVIEERVRTVTILAARKGGLQRLPNEFPQRYAHLLRPSRGTCLQLCRQHDRGSSHGQVPCTECACTIPPP